jgi:hypothetical protein
VIGALAALWALGGGLAQAEVGAGVGVTESLDGALVVWSAEAGVRVYRGGGASGPSLTLSWRSPAGKVTQAVVWRGELYALVSLDPQPPVIYRVGLADGDTRAVLNVRWAYTLTVDPRTGALVLANAGGDLFVVQGLIETDRGLMMGLDQTRPTSVDVLGTRAHDLLWRRDGRLLASGPRGLVIAELGLGGDRRAKKARGALSAQELHVAEVCADRLVTLGLGGQETSLTRWSLMHPAAPWPLHLGAVALDEGALGLIQLPEGVWVLAPGPLEPLDDRLGDPDGQRFPGVLIGASMPELGAWVPAAGLTLHHGDQRGQLALVDEGLRLRVVRPPEVSAACAAPPWGPVGAAHLLQLEAKVRSLADLVSRGDLPVGLLEPGALDGISSTAWRKTVQELLPTASPTNPLPILLSRGFLERFDVPQSDPMRAEVNAREAEVNRETLQALIALFTAGTVISWAALSALRRIRMRDRVLAAAWNPFRQDSPNNPERTPFAANGLADDLMRTLDLNCAVVEGPQFSGKSALLRHVAWRLEREGLGGRVVRLVRLGLLGVPEAEFWTRLGRAMVEALPDSPVAEELQELDTLDRGAVEYLLDESLRDDGPRLVLVLDDLDTLGSYRSEAQRFRGLLQVVPSHRMAVLGAGVSIRKGFAGADEESPWFNLFQVRQLRNMSEAELLAYLDSRLAHPFGYTPDAVRRILSLSEGRPLQVWHLCFGAVEHLLDERRLELRVEHVERARADLRASAGGLARLDVTTLMGADGASEVWEQVVRQIAVARRRREDLLARVHSTRSVAVVEKVAEADFFKQGEGG